MTSGLEVTGEVFNSGASIVFDQPRTACTPLRRSSLPPWDNSTPHLQRRPWSYPSQAAIASVYPGCTESSLSTTEVIGKRGGRVRS